MPRVIATLCLLLLPGSACAGWAQVRGPDGVVRLIEVPGPCGPAGSVAPAPPVDPADMAPRLPQATAPTPPIAQPTRPLVPLAPRPDVTEPKRPRPEPEILRVETPDPLRIEPVGPGFVAIAEALAAIGRQSAAPAAGESCPLPDPTDQAAPPPAATEPRSDLAGDVIYWALAAAAGATGIGVPSIGIWGLWRVARAVIGKIGSKNTHVSSLEASFQRANSWAIPAAPPTPAPSALTGQEVYAPATEARTETVYVRVPVPDPSEEARRRTERVISQSVPGAAAFFAYRDNLLVTQMSPKSKEGQ